jgi:hypothetical protein
LERKNTGYDFSHPLWYTFNAIFEIQDDTNLKKHRREGGEEAYGVDIVVGGGVL